MDENRMAIFSRYLLITTGLFWSAISVLIFLVMFGYFSINDEILFFIEVPIILFFLVACVLVLIFNKKHDSRRY